MRHWHSYGAVLAVALMAACTQSASSSAQQSHYGDPKNGCLSDERNVTVDGVAGDLCAPLCHPNATPACPTDVPAGVTATPQCELTFKDGDKGCILVCSPSVDEVSLRLGDAQCGGGSCQPIQNVGVCTYGAPPPTGLPKGCVASGTGATAAVSCTGNASPEPGCENINRLCCLNQLEDTFSALRSYRAKVPFFDLSLGCPGDFGGADATWANKFGSLLKTMTGLRRLSLDLSFNHVGQQDSILNAIEPALEANPGLANFSLDLSASNISDAGASRLGSMLLAHFKGSALDISLAESDPSDLPNGTPITAKGAEAFAVGLGQLRSLTNLSLHFRLDMNITAHGMARVAVGLQPLQNSLQFLTLDFGYTDNNDPVPSGYPPDFACLGRVLGGFRKLKMLSLNLDGDVGDPENVRALGIHLSCLPIGALPMLDDDSICHCGLKVDKGRGCLVSNKWYSSDLGTGCFTCAPTANATACAALH